MIDIRTPGGRLISVTGNKFTRTLSLAGTRSSTAKQRSRARAGNRVKLGGAMGPLDYAVTAVSTDLLTWRDEDGTEHYTADILL